VLILGNSPSVSEGQQGMGAANESGMGQLPFEYEETSSGRVTSWGGLRTAWTTSSAVALAADATGAKGTYARIACSGRSCYGP